MTGATPDHLKSNDLLYRDFPLKDTERHQVWFEVLGDRTANLKQIEKGIHGVELDLSNQRVIKGDAQRTRATEPSFRDPDSVILLEKTLTYFLKERDFRYKQGINEVLAPFFLAYLDGRNSLGQMYLCFRKFCDRYLLRLVREDDLLALQALSRAFQFLIRYHLPKLAALFQENDLIPELYTMSWLMTLFAAKNDLHQSVLPLWDLVITKDAHELWVPFLGIALLELHESSILLVDPPMLPEFLSRLHIPKEALEVKSLWNRSMILLKATPPSFVSYLLSSFQSKGDTWLSELESRDALFIDASEITVDHSYVLVSHLESLPVCLLSCCLNFQGKTPFEAVFGEDPSRQGETFSYVKLPYLRHELERRTQATPQFAVVAENSAKAWSLYMYLWQVVGVRRVALVRESLIQIQASQPWIFGPMDPAYLFSVDPSSKFPIYCYEDGKIAGIVQEAPLEKLSVPKVRSLEACTLEKLLSVSNPGSVFSVTQLMPIHNKFQSLLIIQKQGITLVDLETDLLERKRCPSTTSELFQHAQVKACVSYYIRIGKVDRITSRRQGRLLSFYLDFRDQIDTPQLALQFDSKLLGDGFISRFKEIHKSKGLT